MKTSEIRRFENQRDAINHARNLRRYSGTPCKVLRHEQTITHANPHGHQGFSTSVWFTVVTL